MVEYVRIENKGKIENVSSRMPVVISGGLIAQPDAEEEKKSDERLPQIVFDGTEQQFIVTRDDRSVFVDMNGKLKAIKKNFIKWSKKVN